MKVLDPRQFIETRSVCALEGRLMQTELMGALGWGGFTPANIRRGANAAAAWGVAHVVPHGVFQEGRVGDENPWTPDWGPASPHFDWMDEWTMAVRRNSWIVANSQPDPDVLLMNPMESAWALSGPSLFDPTVHTDLFNLEAWVDPRLMAIDAAYDGAIKRLAERHVEALAADATYLAEASVEHGALQLRDFSFQVLVLPPLHTASRQSMRLAADLAEAGGVVVALGDLPLASTEQGLHDAELKSSVRRLRAATGFREGTGALDEIAPSTSLLDAPQGILSSARTLDGRGMHWVANQAETDARVLLELRAGASEVTILDPWKGERTTVATTTGATGSPSVALELEALGGRWVLEGRL
jgi:hypothetical protein